MVAPAPFKISQHASCLLPPASCLLSPNSFPSNPGRSVGRSVGHSLVDQEKMAEAQEKMAEAQAAATEAAASGDDAVPRVKDGEKDGENPVPSESSMD